MIRRLALLLLVAGAPAGTTPMLRAIRGRDWNAAAALARAESDRLSDTLVTFLRLLQPGQATADEIDLFLREHPDWPDRGLLLHRRDEAIAALSDTGAVLGLCHARTPGSPEALLRCADAAAAAAHAGTAAGYARIAWPAVSDAAVPTVLARWAPVLRPADEWARFDRLAWAGDPAAAAEVPRLDAAHAAVARARLALRQDAPDAEAALASVPAALRGEPALVLEQARHLRRTNAMAAAVALWREQGSAAELAAPASRRAAFWGERDRLARTLLDAGQVPEARAVAEDPAAELEVRAESLFLTGWIALQSAGDAKAAALRFQALADSAHSVITRSRAFYWLGRARAASGDAGGARAAYTMAAAYPVTFYGQQALAERGQPLTVPPDPVPSTAAQGAFDAGEMARAARLLCAWGDNRRAQDFLLAAAQPMRNAADFALAAAAAQSLELPDAAVRIARLAGREGFMLPQTGWPSVALPPGGRVPAPLALGLIRQESSFAPGIVSPAGAVGLMQLRPATANELARAYHHGRPDLADPATNLRLGTEYLGLLLGQFGGSVPLALAAYDAGPHRAAAWRDAHGVTAGRRATIAWIEHIPFAETRGYVQRVIENAALYAARDGTAFDAFGG